MLPLQRKLTLLEGLEDAEPGVMGGSPREGLARALMELGKPKEALAEWELVLAKHPNRARVLLGAARAAAKAGEDATAHAHYATLLEVWKHADADFPGLEEARQAVAKAPAAEVAPVAPPKPVRGGGGHRQH